MTGDADFPAVINKTMAEIAAFLRRNDFPQLPFYFSRLLYIVHQADQIAEPDAVRVRDNRRFSENISHDQIGAFSSHTRKGEKLLKVIRNLVMIFFMQYLHTAGNIPRLAGTKPARTHNFLYVPDVRLRQRPDTGKFFIQLRGNHVHPFIRTLRSQTNTDKQLPGIPVIQCASRQRVFLLQTADDLKRQFFFIHKSSHGK